MFKKLIFLKTITKFFINLNNLYMSIIKNSHSKRGENYE
jgi:hypothetical protein